MMRTIIMLAFVVAPQIAKPPASSQNGRVRAARIRPPRAIRAAPAGAIGCGSA